MPSDVVVGFVLAVFAAAVCYLNSYLAHLESHGPQPEQAGHGGDIVVIGRRA